MEDRIIHDPSQDGVDRRGFLKCMAWAGTGIIWTVTGGVLGCQRVGTQQPGNPAGAAEPVAPTTDFTFVQISDSHIGFSRPPNTNVTDTLRQAVGRINALPQRPALI